MRRKEEVRAEERREKEKEEMEAEKKRNRGKRREKGRFDFYWSRSESIGVHAARSIYGIA